MATLFRIGKEGFWTGAVGGGLMTVLGLVFLRHTSAAAVTLTLVAGSLFLVSGLARLVLAVHVPEARVPLILTGAVATLLGLVVLFNLFTASLTLLGLLLGFDDPLRGDRDHAGGPRGPGPVPLRRRPGRPALGRAPP